MSIFRIKLKNDIRPIYIKARSFCILEDGAAIFYTSSDVNVAALKDWKSILAFGDINSAKEFSEKE